MNIVSQQYTEYDLTDLKPFVMRVINFSNLLITLGITQTCLYAQPPKAPSQPVTETYFGKQVTDPYRNLEDLKDSAALRWIKAQSDYARVTLDNIQGRLHVIDMIRDLERRKSAKITNLVITDNNVHFYLKTTPSDETGKLYTRLGSEGKETLLFDPLEYSKDTTQKYTIATFPRNGIYPSDDGSLIAFEVVSNGFQNSALLIMNVKEKKLYPERIDRCMWNEVSWLPDNKNFLFNRLQSGDFRDKDQQKNSKVYVHKVGTDPSTDKEFFSAANYPGLGITPEEIPMVYYDKGSHYLFLAAITSSNNLNFFYAPESELNSTSINWKRPFTPADQVSWFNVTDKDLYVYTSKNAPGFKILRTSLQTPDFAHAEVVVPEEPGGTITSFTLTDQGLYYTVLKNGVEASLYHLPNGTKKVIKLRLPFPAGSISLSTMTKPNFEGSFGGFKSPRVWATMTGWTNDSKRYLYLPDKNEFKLESLGETSEYPELSDMTVEEVMVTSHDGVRVPLSLIHKKNIKKDGNNPVMIFGYGAYGNSINPTFSLIFLTWARLDGVMAIAHVRGGGELGKNWHKGGFKMTKPNTWKDLISCTEYLINEKYTNPGKLAIIGGSAGGILIGRAMTERPDLFAVAIPFVGAMNPLRLEESANGPGNAVEFGTVKDSAECMSLIEMDAYLHVKKEEKYPATLITAGMNDPFVVAWQPAKFAARLQAGNGSNKPILFWTDFAAGHGMIGQTKLKAFEGWADFFSFALWQMGNPDFQIK
jgi:prolyl oligopeptidase